MSKAPHERLEAVRRQMTRMGVDAMIVRSADRHLNEYVPLDESARVWVSNFTGSMGEVLITLDDAFLFADGRYWIQAKKETSVDWTVVEVQMGSGLDKALADKLSELSKAHKPKKLRIGYEPERITPKTLDMLQSAVGEGPSWKFLFPSPVEQARGIDRPPPRESGLRTVNEKKVGATVKDKLRALTPVMEELGVQGVLVQKLDDIAYLSNLRGTELPYQATFKCVALVTPDTLFIGIDPSRVPGGVRIARDSVLFVPEAEFWTLMGKRSKRARIAMDPAQNTDQARRQIQNTGAEAVLVPSPVGPMKAHKNKAEMKAMKSAFARADTVVHKAIAWVCKEITDGKRVTEKDFADKVESLFGDYGAVGLSFSIISAAGKNGAIIHYSHPNPRRVLKQGEMMLLDTGGYFEEGYATDLTRTFLLDGPKAKGNAEQCRIYTLVLKAAVAGMKAILPLGARGEQLDALVRAPIWAAGLDYNHGTGHGVGINVHEFPPRVAPGAAVALEENHVFSVEPGIYLPKFGGVRIENLCHVVPAKGKPGFIQVEPLTFSPLDNRLIDVKMLSPEEKAWLADFSTRFKEVALPKKKAA